MVDSYGNISDAVIVRVINITCITVVLSGDDGECRFALHLIAVNMTMTTSLSYASLLLLRDEHKTE